MKTVPTLCASATSIGVSAVGLTIGRPVSSHGADPIPRNPTALQPGRHAMPCVNTRIAHASPFPSVSPSSHTVVRLSHDGRLQQKRVRRGESNASSPRPSATLDEIEIPERDPRSNTIRPATSWVKRLSALSSPTTSRDPSPHPDTTSISNGSMAFSHDGSTVPMIGRSSPTPPLPPNKLVKRSSSMRVASNTTQPYSSRVPTFRRPATSHQRSATLQYQPTLIETPLERLPAPPCSGPILGVQEIEYTHFFKTELSKDKSISKKRHPVGETRSIKRLLPDSRHQPVLLPAKSVTAYTVQLNEFSDVESLISNNHSITLDSDPISQEPETSQIETTQPSSHHAEIRTRRAFSIGDLWVSGQQVWKQRGAKHEVAKLKRNSSRRLNSAPPSTLASQSINEKATKLPLDTNSQPSNTIKQSASPSGRSRQSSEPSRSATYNFIQSRIQTIAHSERISSPGLSGSSMEAEASIANINSVRSKQPQLAMQGSSRPPRYSLVSEPTSTLIGSDTEARGLGSGDEDDMDFQSDTVFDSIRTRTTRSTSVSRGPHIETIFDESPPTKDKSSLFSHRGVTKAIDGAGGSKITEEDEHAPSPSRTATTETIRGHSPSRHRTNATTFPTVPTSTPDMPKPLNLGTLEWDTVPEEDDCSWSFSGDEDENAYKEPKDHLQAPTMTPTKYRLSLGAASRSSLSTPRNTYPEYIDRDARSSIFDWSEQPPQDKSPGNGTPPRPKTVHGKKDADVRGSRSLGRRAPSALHARSQSVPVVPDAAGKREPVVTNKFGTWGVGSKGVTEDWDDDFDFSSPNDATPLNDENARIDSGFSMLVPKNIQEQQTKVLANIGLLREWGLLIEELKELRVRAATLDLLDGPYLEIWEEVEAMIDLADQEVDDPVAHGGSRSSSPGFEFDAFDDKNNIPTMPSHGDSIEHSHIATSLASHNGRARRRSILASTNSFRDYKPPSPPVHAVPVPTTPPSRSLGRPRKDSEAVARSVIEALQNRKTNSDPVDSSEKQELGASTNKVPFDTGTLKHIVPYVHGLMRKVKDVMREAEGLNISPYQSLRKHPKPLSPPHPPLSDLFRDTKDAKTGSPYTVKESDLTTQMKFTTVI